MKKERQNKMAVEPINKLIIKMGLPMIISMVLQALYNVIDSIFVANMEAKGAIANQALTYAFPVQIMIIAIGVGTGVGLNAILSKSLGENDKEKVNKISGNGIFLSICIYLVFLLFGLFGSKWFISLFTSDKEKAFHKDEHSTYEIDATIVATHMILEAPNLDIDTTWIEAFDHQETKKLFNIDNNYIDIIFNLKYIYQF